MMWGMMNGWGYGGNFIWGLIWMIVEIGLVIGAIYFIVSLFQNNKGGYRKNDAMEILRERYARGEISEEEYLERKKNLEEK
ncbi:putative membrane protein [Thermoanaerobacterium sp. RBIITD]|nr:SHOCT domain-containing protein [Thermoanaerobacterium sp. RBIITD]SNX52681.1 putative membrane protein [Thermoanaerobacterium sp. RBIITD]